MDGFFLLMLLLVIVIEFSQSITSRIGATKKEKKTERKRKSGMRLRTS